MWMRAVDVRVRECAVVGVQPYSRLSLGVPATMHDNPLMQPELQRHVPCQQTRFRQSTEARLVHQSGSAADSGKTLTHLPARGVRIGGITAKPSQGVYTAGWVCHV